MIYTASGIFPHVQNPSVWDVCGVGSTLTQSSQFSQPQERHGLYVQSRQSRGFPYVFLHRLMLLMCTLTDLEYKNPLFQPGFFQPIFIAFFFYDV